MARQKKATEIRTLGEYFSEEELAYYQVNPVDFIYTIIFNSDSVFEGGNLYLSDQQVEVLHELGDFDVQNISVVSGKGVGKGIAVNTYIPMAYDMKKRVGDIAVGDKLIGKNGKPTKVTGVYPQGMRNQFIMKFSSGVETIVDSEHRWEIFKRSGRPSKVMTTMEIKDFLDTVDERREKGNHSSKGAPTVGRPYIEFCDPVEYPKKELHIDPYVLGVVLGDGHIGGSVSVSNEERDILTSLQNIQSMRGFSVSDYHADGGTFTLYKMGKEFDKYNLRGKRAWDKFIPHDYLYSSVEDRIELIRGLFDTDGHVCKGAMVEYVTVSKELSDGVAQVVRSLGGQCVIAVKEEPVYEYKGEKLIGRKAYRCFVKFTNGIIPVASKKHLNRWTGKSQRKYNYIESITQIEDGETVCFSVDAEDSLFLCNDYIVTHNTALMAMSVIWFITCFSRPKIILTAPSFPQLKSALWPEVDKWLKQSLVKDLFEYTSEKLYYRDPDHKSNWFAEPRTAKEKENMQGLHADNMLLIVDEGSGVSDEIFDALDTTMTAEENIGINKLLTMGNGTKTDGTFYESHHRFKKDWKTFAFSSLDSPFVNTAKSKKLIEKYGWEHDVVRVSVRGLFPLGNPDSLIPLNRVEDAVGREVVKGKEIHIGVDVARFGDDLTALTWREGNFVHPQITKGKTSIDETVGMVLSLVKKIRKETGSTDTIFVKIDDTGVGGGCTDYLKLDNEHNIEVIPVNFAVKATDSMYQNTPSQIWGTILDKIDSVCLPDDDFLKAELSARTFKVPNGKIYIQPKAEFKKEYKESPDKADSLGLCLFDVKNQTVILPEFDRYDKELVKQSIRYTDLMTKVVSIWYSKDMVVSMVLGAWDGFRLSILEEFVGNEDIYSITEFINNFGTNCEIIGSESMFGESSGDVKHQYRKMGVRLKKNRKYDEMGSTQGVVNFIREKRIVTQSNCTQVISQFDDWSTHVARKELETKYGTCYATANLLSFVRENRQSSFNLPVQPTEYKKEESFGAKIRHNPISKW